MFFQLKTHAHAFSSGVCLLLCALLLLCIAIVHGHIQAPRVSSLPEYHLSQEAGDEPSLSMVGAVAGLTVCTAVVAMCSEFLTGSLEAVAHNTGLSADFLGLIVLPIAGNACEHLTAVYVAGRILCAESCIC